MKLRPIWWAMPALACICTSCKKETPATSEPGTVATETQAGQQPKAPEVPQAPPALSAEERAAKFGIVKHLPKDIESVVTFYNGGKAADRFKKTKLWSIIEEEADLDTEESANVDVVSGPGLLLGQEVFLATGKGTAEQCGNLNTASRRLSYFRMKQLAKALVAASKNEEGMAELRGGQWMTEAYTELAKDSQSGIALLEKVDVPPLYLGFKVKPEKIEEVEQQLVAGIGFMSMLGEMVEPVEFEKAGGKFAGFRVLGAKISEELASGRKDLEKVLDGESIDRLLATVATQDVIVVSGKVGDYEVVFIGNKPDDFQLTANLNDSLAASDALRFADAYASKELAALSYGSQNLLKVVDASSGGLADIAQGLCDGIAAEPSLGDTRDLQSLLQMVAEREKALLKLSSSDAQGIVAFFEDGFKIESFGGVDQGAIDWKKPSRLADLGKPADVVFFANASSDSLYDEKARAYAEALVETGYALTMKFANASVASEEFKQFQAGAKVFDTEFRGDVVTLIDALRGDFSTALGNEGALVVDLKGSVPPVPGIPQAVADKGKFVRASWIAPVTDRSKLSVSWDKINGATANLLKKVSGMAGQEIPMQKPMSSEKNGFTTWFFAMPFFNDDFVPSVTVGDKWFVASTSKLQALELTKAAEEGKEGRQGFWLEVKFDPIRRFGQDWLKLVDENATALFGEEDEKLDEFRDNKPDIEKSLAVLEDVEALTVHARRENGQLRGSVHLKSH